MRAYLSRKLGLAKCAKRKARRNITVEVTLDDVMALYEKQGRKCAVTGFELTHEGSSNWDASIDRIDSDGSYTLDNIRLVCWAVNFMRGRMTDEHLLLWSQAIVEGMNRAD